MSQKHWSHYQCVRSPHCVMGTSVRQDQWCLQGQSVQCVNLLCLDSESVWCMMLPSLSPSLVSQLTQNWGNSLWHPYTSHPRVSLCGAESAHTHTCIPISGSRTRTQTSDNNFKSKERETPHCPHIAQESWQSPHARASPETRLIHTIVPDHGKMRNQCSHNKAHVLAGFHQLGTS